MIRCLPVLCAVMFVTGGVAQVTAPSHYGSPTGFGNINYPGVGHPPTVIQPGVITDATFPGRLGASVRGYPGYSSGYRGMSRGPAHPSHSRQTIVPVPVIIGGGYYPYDGNMGAGYGPDQPQMQQPATPPVVIINQAYRPEPVGGYADDSMPSALRRYDAPVHPLPDPNDAEADPKPPKRTRTGDDDKPTIYLIAFKDHTILPALAYWMEGDTLNYITQQGTPNRASLTLIDRDFSKQLNRERQIDFNLP